MSIPLVQEATKDAINTSIIAIKRNIERINMLLGLVDNDSPDLSGFATKQELQDAVTELQPVDEVTVGNMHSVTSNAVAVELKRTLIATGTTALGGTYKLYKYGHIRELYLNGLNVPASYDNDFLFIGQDNAPEDFLSMLCEGGTGSIYISTYAIVWIKTNGWLYIYGYGSGYPALKGHIVWTVD